MRRVDEVEAESNAKSLSLHHSGMAPCAMASFNASNESSWGCLLTNRCSTYLAMMNLVLVARSEDGSGFFIAVDVEKEEEEEKEDV